MNMTKYIFWNICFVHTMNDNILDPFHFCYLGKKSCFCKVQCKKYQFLIYCELDKNIISMFLLLCWPYIDIFSESVQMFSQLSILSHLNKQLYYCASSQHALHLEKIMWQLIQNDNFFTFWWLDLCCSCCCHCCLAAIWFRVHIFGELTFVDLCVWDLCVEVHVHFITTAGCNIFG